MSQISNFIMLHLPLPLFCRGAIQVWKSILNGPDFRSSSSPLACTYTKAQLRHIIHNTFLFFVAGLGLIRFGCYTILVEMFPNYWWNITKRSECKCIAKEPLNLTLINNSYYHQSFLHASFLDASVKHFPSISIIPLTTWLVCVNECMSL